jgi:hypothetical protein
MRKNLFQKGNQFGQGRPAGSRNVATEIFERLQGESGSFIDTGIIANDVLLRILSRLNDGEEISNQELKTIKVLTPIWAKLFDKMIPDRKQIDLAAHTETKVHFEIRILGRDLTER